MPTTTLPTVCGGCVSNELLDSAGLTVRVTEKSMGTDIIVKDGLPKGTAVKAAREAGLVRLGPCPTCSALVKARCVVGPTPARCTPDPDMMAWALNPANRWKS